MATRKKFVTISLYNTEKYHNDKANNKKGTLGVQLIKLDVTGLSDKEIEDLVSKKKAEQKEYNKAYKMVKHNSPKPTKPAEKVVQRVSGLQQSIKEAFDEDTGNTFVLFGSSKSGKSTLMMKIYNDWFTDQKKILTTLFAMNDQIPVYNTGSSAKYIIKSDKFDDNCAEYIDWQRRVNKNNDNKFHFLNMFDDFIDVRYNKMMNNLILTYRNSNMSAIICLQYVKLLSKASRTNANNIFLLTMNTDEAITDAIKSFLAGTIKRNKFCPEEDCIAWYRDKTSNHNYIHINPLHQFIYFSKSDEIFKL